MGNTHNKQGLLVSQEAEGSITRNTERLGELIDARLPSGRKTASDLMGASQEFDAGTQRLTAVESNGQMDALRP